MEHKTITTSRLTTAYRVHGTPGARKLLLIHGNASSSAFYEPLMERLADEFYMVAPDLRCFGGSDALPWTPRGACATSPTTTTSWSRPWAGKSSPSWAGPWAAAWPCSTP